MLEDKLDDRAIGAEIKKSFCGEEKREGCQRMIVYQDQETDTIWFHVQHDEEEDVIGILEDIL